VLGCTPASSSSLVPSALEIERAVLDCTLAVSTLHTVGMVVVSGSREVAWVAGYNP
jgi:hypothetical protein